MSEIFLELIRSFVLGLLFIYLVHIGNRKDLKKEGWNFIIAGFGLILFGSIMDITENFPQLNRFVIIGDTKTEAVLEKLIGDLLGALVLAFGLWKWMPRVGELQKEIEQKKKTEEVLQSILHRTEQEKLRSEGILSAVPEAISIQDGDLELLYQNPVHKKLFGESHGTECYALLGLKEICPDCPAVKTFQNGKSFSLEMDIRTAEGVQNFELTTSPLRDKTGQITAVVEVARNITLKKKLEHELLRADKLESLGVIAGGLAHDFNNILTAILGNLSVAKIHIKQDQAALDRIIDAEKAGQRARAITSQLLTFTKSGGPVKKAASIGQLIEETAKFTIRGSQASCLFDIPPDLWPVNMDQSQISNVIQNLLLNAIQAMPEGGTVEMKCANVLIGPEDALPLKEAKYVRISVIDKGVGIPSEHLPRIFDPYFTTKEMGSGLGLATSHSIIKRHEGHITVKSIPGSGSVFDIYLPVSDETLSEAEKETSGPVTGNGKVLVMDDEGPVRDIIVLMLKTLGYEAHSASNGAEAIKMYSDAILEGRPFSCAIFDLTVSGGMGGKETFQKIAQMDSGARIILSSGYLNNMLISDYLKMGFKGCIKKPYDLIELGRMLRETLKIPRI